MADDDKQQPKMTSSFWFDEEVTADHSMRMRMTSLKYDKHSQFQRVQVVETVPFGTTLVLDGKTQSAKHDEYVYHETLVHPALLLHEAPKRVYIGGGGELATARECLKHASVEEVVMVDLDGDVVVRSRRPAVLRCLHAIDATRFYQTRSWVVSFPILRPFGPSRETAMLRAGTMQH